jgi:hypothetical protein
MDVVLAPGCWLFCATLTIQVPLAGIPGSVNVKVAASRNRASAVTSVAPCVRRTCASPVAVKPEPSTLTRVPPVMGPLEGDSPTSVKAASVVCVCYAMPNESTLYEVHIP